MTQAKILATFLLISVLSLNGCVPLAVGAGAVAVGTAGKTASEERGMGGAVSDTQIATRINYLWFQHDREMFHMLTLSVREGRALIAGVVDSDKRHLDAIRLAWQAKGVKEVIDQVRVSQQKGTVSDYTRDAWITTKLKSLMLMDKYIASRNYNIKTVGAVVYVMGIAQSQDELRRVTDLASNISGVRRVVSYARIKGH